MSEDIKNTDTDKNEVERRMSFRIPLRVLKIDEGLKDRDVFFGYAKDLSTGGMQIQTTNPKEKGSIFKVRFELDNDKKIDCNVEVIWSKDFNSRTKDNPGMGLKFLELNIETKRKIEEFIKKNS